MYCKFQIDVLFWLFLLLMNTVGRWLPQDWLVSWFAGPLIGSGPCTYVFGLCLISFRMMVYRLIGSGPCTYVFGLCLISFRMMVYRWLPLIVLRLIGARLGRSWSAGFHARVSRGRITRFSALAVTLSGFLFYLSRIGNKFKILAWKAKVYQPQVYRLA